MATAHRDTVLRHIRQLMDRAPCKDVPDSQLLHAFVTGHGEAAFATLLRRHGPMVLSTCRRVLRNEQDAEDAFQATFLVLARKAASIRSQESVSCWLHSVAHRLALRAKAQKVRRQIREEQAAAQRTPAPQLKAAWGELQQALDTTLRSLPEKYRTVLLLCYLEDRTQEEVAKQLGCPLGTVRSRLAQGRKLLRERLARRGLAPSAGALAALLAASGPAALPATLQRQTLQAAVALAAGQAAGLVSAQVTNLITGGLESMFATRVKMATLLLCCVGLLALGVGLCTRALEAQQPRNGAEQRPLPSLPQGPPARREPQAAPVGGQAEGPDAKTTMTVTGEVRDAQGQAVANAAVAILAWRNSPWYGGDLSPGRTELLGQAKADAKGTFRLRVRRTDSVRFLTVHAVAAAPGHALGWQELGPDADSPNAVIQLPAETVIRGRLLDLQGQPAAGVKVVVNRFARNVRGEPRGVSWSAAPELLPLWPQPVTTDAQGRFELRGVNRDSGVFATVRDPRFALANFALPPEKKGKDGEVSLTLTPAQVIEGRLTYADTGKPAVNARVFASVDPTVRGDNAVAALAIGGTGTYGTRTDAEGRFRLSPARGLGYIVTAYPAEGEPYFTVYKRHLWSRGEVKARVDLALPRGIQVRGKVTEAPSGQPVEGAGVYYQPLATNPAPRKGLVLSGTDGGVLTGRDGTFQVTVLPGAGHLLVSGPTLDYVRLEVEGNKLYNGKSGGRRSYPHGLVALDPKPGSAPLEVAVMLRRGVSVSGRLVGPDGQPVTEAFMFCRLNGWPWFIDYHPHLSHRHVRDGRFALHGLEPDKSYPVYFLDPRNKLGAVVHVASKQAGGEPLVVRLAPCGSASLRIIDPDGKPWANYRPPVEFIITSGVSSTVLTDEGGPVVADAESLVNLDRLNYWDLKTDADGRVTLPALIPGATYRLSRWTGDGWGKGMEFTVEAGRTRNLPDLVMKRSP
jgi:RNA polymerase sigma factor (sigma-70 family)